ncbi:hypothetical protein CO2235_MP70099 [Cupriavidus oxalaticus]|uniref:Uncharacterized protein n=1 Tax=Cupriavidus oxalaticus TaxID=96344 RepID=A0A976BIV2_9BURK|nr:hypothetical protein CO2235_MP70099 [Cupriavidus oxalaticus]
MRQTTFPVHSLEKKSSEWPAQGRQEKGERVEMPFSYGINHYGHSRAGGNPVSSRPLGDHVPFGDEVTGFPPARERRWLTERH